MFDEIKIVAIEQQFHKRLFLGAWHSSCDVNAGNNHISIPEVYLLIIFWKCLMRSRSLQQNNNFTRGYFWGLFILVMMLMLKTTIFPSRRFICWLRGCLALAMQRASRAVQFSTVTTDEDHSMVATFWNLTLSQSQKINIFCFLTATSNSTFLML